ncbi:unnamed protein product, partial [Amoebophrya sp. A120]|eukprot:GSA120T00000865001.1
MVQVDEWVPFDDHSSLVQDNDALAPFGMVSEISANPFFSVTDVQKFSLDSNGFWPLQCCLLEKLCRDLPVAQNTYYVKSVENYRDARGVNGSYSFCAADLNATGPSNFNIQHTGFYYEEDVSGGTTFLGCPVINFALGQVDMYTDHLNIGSSAAVSCQAGYALTIESSAVMVCGEADAVFNQALKRWEVQGLWRRVDGQPALM